MGISSRLTGDDSAAVRLSAVSDLTAGAEDEDRVSVSLLEAEEDVDGSLVEAVDGVGDGGGLGAFLQWPGMRVWLRCLPKQAGQSMTYVCEAVRNRMICLAIIVHIRVGHFWLQEDKSLPLTEPSMVL